MKKILNTKILTVAFVALLFVMSGCNEDEFLNKYPLDKPSPETFFVNAKSAQSAVTAAMNPWFSSAHTYNRDMMIIMDGMTDDAYWRPARANSIQQERWDLTPSHVVIGKYWEAVYQSINAANFAIEGIPTSTDGSFTEEAQKPYIAHARFIRAFDYLFLTTFYGDVPLITKPLSSFEEFSQPRTDKASIEDLIIEDLKYAKENLPVSWADAEGAPTKATGAAYLAKAYLYQKDYANAETAAREAIQIAESTGYTLVDDYKSIFSEDNEKNPELLFYISYMHNIQGYGQNATIQRMARHVPTPLVAVWGGGGWGYLLPQRDLYDAFEEGDPRREATIFAPGDDYGIYPSAEPYTYTYQAYDESTGELIEEEVTYNTGDMVKYDYRWSETGLNASKLITNVGDLTNVRWSGQDMPVLRMADLYLFLAEALAEQGNNEALVWVNKVRARASVNMPAKTAADGNLVDIVRHERRVELALEGVRLFDIMRWENIGDIFNSPTAVKRHYYSDVLTDALATTKYDEPFVNLPANLLFPIPQAEIDQNDQINTNNPGYD